MSTDAGTPTPEWDPELDREWWRSRGVEECMDRMALLAMAVNRLGRELSEAQADFDAEYTENKTFQQVAADLREQLRVAETAYDDLLRHNQETAAELEAERKAREESHQSANRWFRECMQIACKIESAEQRVKELELREIGRAGKLLLAEQRAAELQARLGKVEAATIDNVVTLCRKLYSTPSPGIEYDDLGGWRYALIQFEEEIRALSAQPNAAAGQEAAYPSGEDAVTSGQPAPSAAPIAHSKSQYRRLVAQGADAPPPLELFGLAVLRESRAELGDIDGGWIQDKAEEFGLLVRHYVIEPCGEQCRCEDFPGNCFRYSPATEAAIQLVVPVDWPFKVLP